MAVAPQSLLRQTLLSSGKLEVRRSPRHGWGVFATAPLEAYELLEEAPYVLVPREQIDAAPAAEVYCYHFDDAQVLIGFGMAGLYNHSVTPNADYELDRINGAMRHYTLRPVAAGEELTLHYGEENIERYNLLP